MKGKIYLVGNPNCGKSTIFNSLTGLNQKVSNLAGTTVEIKVGQLLLENKKYSLYDLPGTYSIFPKSEEEEIANQEIIKNHQDIDLIIYVADAKQLYRNMLYFSQLSRLNIPVVLLINMWDTVESKNLSYSPQLLEEQLKIPVITYSAKNDERQELLKLLKPIVKEKKTTSFFNEETVNALEIHKADNIAKAKYTVESYQKVSLLFNKVAKKNIANPLTAKLDRIFMHPVGGFFIFGFIMFLLFQMLFTIAAPPMEWIEILFQKISGQLQTVLPQDFWLSNLLIHGIVPGIGGVVVFVPQIALLYLFLTLLEDTGYMSRISYLLDSVMRQFGLSGKSVIPLVGGFACAIPAMMSARTINNKKDRLITLMVTPLISCSARLPVYTILIALLAVKNTSVVNQKGLIFFGLYIFGLVAAMLIAFLFKKILPTDKTGFFILEMPQYRKPVLRNVITNAWNKTLDFIKGAGGVILVVAIILWFLASFGPPAKMQQVRDTYAVELNKPNLSVTAKEQLNKSKNADLMAESFAGHLGKAIEPVVKPLGYDWKIGIAIITSFAAREVFVGTLSTIYAVEKQGNDGIVERLHKAKDEQGNLVYTTATIVSLLVFYMFALQCFSTIAVMKKETAGWKWPIIQFLYLGFLAYGGAWIAYQVFS